MRSIIPTLLLTLLTTTTHATGTLTVLNNCRSSIYLKHDAEGYSGETHTLTPTSTLSLGSLDTEKFGNSIKFSLSETGFDRPVSFDYTVTDGIAYYDISDGAGLPVSLWGFSRTEEAEPACRSVGCPGPRCKSIQACGAEFGFQLTACYE